MNDSRRTSIKKKVIGELGRQESTVGEQLLKGLPGQYGASIDEEEPENEEGKHLKLYSIGTLNVIFS